MKGGWPVGSLNGALVVKTDDPAQPQLRIPVQGSVMAVIGGQ
jgi:hypothetical protein